MSKKARLRKANRRHLESEWKSRNYQGPADMVKDFYDMKGWNYKQVPDGIAFKSTSMLWRLHNHPTRISGIAVWGIGKHLNSPRFPYQYITEKNLEYLQKRAKEEIFKLWNQER